MNHLFSIEDVVPEELAVPPGASVHDLRAGAWTDDRGGVVVRNVAQLGDSCQLCGHMAISDLKREFRVYPHGTVGRGEHPDGHHVVTCFNFADCDGRQAAASFGGTFPPELCCTQYPLPSYWRWASGHVYGEAVVLDRWLPAEARSLALAARALAIWANAETVSRITETSVFWDRPAEIVGARAEYIDMFAAAAHGLAVLDRARSNHRSTYFVFAAAEAHDFAEKLHLRLRYGDQFWEQPVIDAACDALAPLIVDEQLRPASLVCDVACAIESAGDAFGHVEAEQIRAGFPIASVAPVDWRVGLRPDNCNSSEPGMGELSDEESDDLPF